MTAFANDRQERGQIAALEAENAKLRERLREADGIERSNGYVDGTRHARLAYAQQIEAVEARATAAETDLNDIKEENAKIQVDNEGLHTQLRAAERALVEREAARATLSAQNEALRKALETIENIDLQWADGLDSNVERIKTIARAALSLPAPSPSKVAALVEALTDARNNGLIYWEPNTTRGHVAKAEMMARIDAALTLTGKESNDKSNLPPSNG